MGDEEHLPSHRRLFAALIPPSPPLPAGSDIFAGTSLADAAAAAASSSEAAVTDRPSFAEHSNWRRQLLTLHVVFPNLLLPALDLLDRGLVSRLVVPAADGEHEAARTHATAEPGTETAHEDATTSGIISNSSGKESDSPGQIHMYTVQSAASSNTSRRKRHTPLRNKTYAVHLDAWNCSCGGFALDAYSHYYDPDNQNQQSVQRSASPLLRLGSLEMASPDDFPCCKHLLACLLAEKWKTYGGHGRDKHTTKEELAAMIGGT
ncbi:hypothetical protein MKX07_001990 [Trichoderma sp. CBMAI-0711]|uniref:SWIM-type domain-containing protein n=1 Tax=Trichoderma parareesei TaxID=858221 RepID=A0A2H2Z9Z0_TRIPA|nr:hypothetical protein MKX07_001990 [Trichoderma sp. CBMAI-0711]OTA04607.1 hypothetical protein A9Z42_0052000 [Trichoderma parareesei]